MSESFDDFEYRKTNREKSLSPKSGVHWCDKCDANLVGAGAKCSVCGFRHGKKIKKETNA